MSTPLSDRLTDNWLLLHAVAILSATFHALVDWHIGLFGPSATAMSPAQAGVAFGMGLITASWGLGLAWAARGEARGYATVLIAALLWGFLGNGLVIAACPPPCPDGFPYQDLSHVGSLVFGLAAAWASWRHLQAADGKPGWLAPALMVGVIVVVFALEAALVP